FIHQQPPCFKGSQLFLERAGGKCSADARVCRPSGPIKNIHPVVTPVTSKSFLRTSDNIGEISVPSFSNSAISLSTRKLEFFTFLSVDIRTPSSYSLYSIQKSRFSLYSHYGGISSTTLV